MRIILILGVLAFIFAAPSIIARRVATSTARRAFRRKR